MNRVFITLAYLAIGLLIFFLVGFYQLFKVQNVRLLSVIWVANIHLSFDCAFCAVSLI